MYEIGLLCFFSPEVKLKLLDCGLNSTLLHFAHGGVLPFFCTCATRPEVMALCNINAL